MSLYAALPHYAINRAIYSEVVYLSMLETIENLGYTNNEKIQINDKCSQRMDSDIEALQVP